MIPKFQNGKSKGAYFTRLKYRPNWQQYVLIISDVHLDALHSDRKLFKKHLTQAQELNAPVIINGDLLDLTGHKLDPRNSKHEIDPLFATSEDYLGDICEYTADFLAPFAENIVLLGYGNHEWEYKRRHEICPLSIVATHLKLKTGVRPIVAPYTFWVQFKCESHTGGRRKTVRAKFHHGAGGNSPVTKGMIASNRSVVNWDADVYVRSHIHNRFTAHLPYERISATGVILEDQSRLYLQTGAYVSDYKNGNSWSQRKAFGSPSLGGYWLRLYCDTTSDPNNLIKWIAYPTD